MEHSESIRVDDVLIDRYVVNGWKSGAMGRVYFCKDMVTNLPIAIKTLDLDKLSVDGTKFEILAKQLEGEAYAWITLEANRHIVQAKYVEWRDTQLYIFMEYVPGKEALGGRQRELNSWIRKWFGLLGQEGIDGQLKQILDFAIQICTGMEYAAQIFSKKKKGFVHQDIKPDNILVTYDGIVKITDFGLVKAFQGKGEAFLVGAGTPEYMAPEQWSYKGETGIQTDVYAFGCVLYKMITGDPPFPCDRLGGRQCEECDRCKEHHLYSIPETVYSQVANIPDKLDSIVMKCLDKQLGEFGRYKNFSIIKQDLIELYKDYVGKAYRPPPAVIPAPTQHMIWGISLCQVGGRQEAIGQYINAMEMDPEIAFEIVPPTVADTLDFYCPPSGARNTNGKLVFLVDNLHANYSQQKNLNRVLDILVGKYGLALMSLEGGKDKIDLSFYREIEMTEQEKTQKADFFLKNAKINGAEFFAIVTGRDILLYGADTDKHIHQTEAFKHALGEMDESLQYCQIALHALNLLSNTIYNDSLKIFLAEKMVHEKHPNYLSYLNHYMSKLYIKGSFPNFDRACEYFASSRSNYDVEAANKEREILIDLLLEKLPNEKRYSLANAIFSFNKGSITEYRLFQYMTHSIDEYSNLDVHNLYPNFIKQMNRLIFLKGIDFFELFEYEIPIIEEKIRERLCPTEARRKVDHFKKYLKQLQRWYSLRMQPYEAQTILKGEILSSGKELIEFLKNEAKMRGICVISVVGERGCCQRKTIFLPDRIEQLSIRAGPQMDFYSIALVRSSGLIENCLRQADLERECGAVLVAGGFHLHFLIARYLKERSIPYVLIAPKVENLDDNDGRYFRAILNNSDDNTILQDEDIIPNNSLLYLETQNTVISRLLGMVLNNFIVNPLRIMSC